LSDGLKAYVSVDLEGIPGIAGLLQLIPGQPLYGDARKLITLVVDSVAEELYKCGFEHVVIADSHGYMTNVIYAELKTSAWLLQGFPRPFSMVNGLEKEKYDAALFIGYHAPAGSSEAYLSHTMSSSTIQRVYVNGELASEYYLNALYAGEYGVPVVMVAGDEALREHVKKHTPWAVFIPLKKGVAWSASLNPPLHEIVRKLREGVKEAWNVLKSGKARPLKLANGAEVLIEVKREIVVELASLIPGAERVDAFTIKFRAKDAVDVLRFVELVTFLGAAAKVLLPR